MQVNRKDELVRVGSLVMWNREHSEDYQCMGIVTYHYFEQEDDSELFTEFIVLWSDNDSVEYDYGDLWREHIKVVKF